MGIWDIVLGPVVDIVKTYQDNRTKEKQQKAEIDSALQTKKLEQISQSADYAQAFRMAQVQSAGWRPGYWTIVLSLPVVMCFVPSLTPYVSQGFAALATTPEWFRYFLGIAVTSAFGYSAVDKAYEWWKAP